MIKTGLVKESVLTSLIMVFATVVSAQTVVPHKNAPGPARLAMPKADNSGAVNANPEFIADRLAILNHVSAYAYLIDEGYWEDWLALFSDDVSLEMTTPGIGTIIIKGKKPFRAFITERYIKGGATSTAVRRHIMGNIHVASQTATKAQVRTYMLITNVPNADKVVVLTTGTYNANLEKRNGRWTITRWYISCDAPLAPSKLPAGFSPDEVKFIPDPRAPKAAPAAPAQL
jgi:3-phenylpropionate/cinnamic acid dioxygenase small subunit